MEYEESGPELWMPWLRLCLQVACELRAVGESHEGSLKGLSPLSTGECYSLGTGGGGLFPLSSTLGKWSPSV